MPIRLLLVGGGKMGGAMLEGWLKSDLRPTDVVVLEPHPETAHELANRFGIVTVTSADDIPTGTPPETIVLAVKPQVMEDAIAPLSALPGPQSLVVSIAAGKTIASFERVFSPDAAIVRAMPNTPAAVGRGITVCCANEGVTHAQRDWTTTLLQSVGEVAWVDDEGQIDAVTALSGGGPAYVFLLAEVMAHAGVEAGLPADLAARLARVTVAGAGELLHQSPDGPATLRKNVTSPGGTTAEALRVLMTDDALQTLMTEAVRQATLRSRELAG